MERNNKDLLKGINIGIAIGLALGENKSDILNLYKNIMQFSTLPTKDLENNMTNFVKKHANEDFKTKNYNQAFLKYLDIFNNAELSKEEYKNIALTLIELNQSDIAQNFLDIYDNIGQDDFSTQKDLGWIYFSLLKDYEKAIKHYENSIKLYDKDPEVFNVLGHIYSLHYKDKKLEQQLEYFLNAFNLKKNTRLYIRNVIFTLFRIGQYDEVENFYQKLLKLNPEHKDYYYYGCFLIWQGKLKEGYTYLQHRFLKESDDASIIPAVLDKTRYWQGESLVGKKLLVHCEQGFGDTILYARFVKDISKKATKVYFIVQDELFELMNNSNLGAEIYSTNFELAKLDYDYFTTIMDLPLYLDLIPENIPYKEGYLKLPAPNINNSNLKIGFAFKGHEKLKENARDLLIEELSPIFKIPNIEFYSLQVDCNEILPTNVINLGQDFKNFNDTAKAIASLDLIVSTDNAVLNLAGALGKRTIGLFNRFVDYRWFNIQNKQPLNWYSNVTVLQNSEQDNWTQTIENLCLKINHIKEELHTSIKTI